MAKREKTKHKGIYRVGDKYYITYYVDGKKHEKEAGDKLDRAQKEKAKYEEKAKKGKYAIIDRMEKTTFKELMDLYKKKGENKSYILDYESRYVDFFGDRKLASISRSDLFEFRDKVKTTPKQNGGGEITNSTVNNCMAGLRRLFNFAIGHEYLDETPFPKDPKSGLLYAKKRGKKKFFKEAILQKILDEAAKPIWPRFMEQAIVIGYYTGMRDGDSELFALQWPWIDFESGIIKLPKTKTLDDPDSRGQEIVMQRELIEYLKAIPVQEEEEEEPAKRKGYVICMEDGTRVHQWHFYKRFKKILSVIGLDPKQYCPKELRHTTGTLMYLKGAPVKAIADQLRHEDEKTTKDFYIGADPEFQRSQNELLTLQNQVAEA